MSLEKAKDKQAQFILYKFTKESIDTRKIGRSRLDLSNLQLTGLDGIASLAVKDGTTIIALCNSKRLQLVLLYNRLKKIPFELAFLTNLEELKLSHNELEELEGPLCLLGTLKKLALAHNNIKQLPKEITNLTHLTTLDLTDNHFTAFPEVLLNLFHLKKLYLEKNKISTIPAKITTLSDLTSLNLSDTGITLSPATVEALKGLNSLSLLRLCNNNLKELPQTFGDLTSLEELHLNHNQLEDLPTALESLNKVPPCWKEFPEYMYKPKLLALHLSHNHFSNFPSVLLTLTSLRRLYLDHNLLSKLPESMRPLDGLIVLDLSANKLTKLPDMSANDLAFLFLNNNEIKELPKSFGACALCCLELRHNMLARLPEWLTHFERLSRLDLSDNRLGMTKDGIYQPVLSLDDIAMFQPTLWETVKTLGKPSPVKVFLEKLMLEEKKYGQIVTFRDPFGYLSLLPKDILYEVYRYLNPPAVTDWYYPSTRDYNNEAIKIFFHADLKEKRPSLEH